MLQPISVRQELEKIEKDMAKAVEAAAEPASAAASSVAEPVKVGQVDGEDEAGNAGRIFKSFFFDGEFLTHAF